jgi:hypothetical protein
VLNVLNAPQRALGCGMLFFEPKYDHASQTQRQPELRDAKRRLLATSKRPSVFCG